MKFLIHMHYVFCKNLCSRPLYPLLFFLLFLRLDVGIAKHCRVMSVITPTAVGRARGPYVERPSWHEIAGPTKATDR